MIPPCLLSVYGSIPTEHRREFSVSVGRGETEDTRYATVTMLLYNEIFALCAVTWDTTGVQLCQCNRAAEWYLVQ